MEINVALNHIQQVINQYKAFKVIEEVLVLVGEQERLINDLNLAANALRSDIGALETAKEAASSDHAAAKAAQAAEIAAAKEQTAKVTAQLKDRILRAEVSLKAATEKLAQAEEVYAERISELHAKVLELTEKANEEERRYEAAVVAIKEVKARLS